MDAVQLTKPGTEARDIANGTPICLGPWEKAMVLEHLRDDSHCVNWMVELDTSLDPALVCAALEALRPAFPLHFARLQIANDGIGVVSIPDTAHPISAFLVEQAHFAGGGRAYARVLANMRLDPLVAGLFRCHFIAGPTPLLAFQVSHIAGDGYTNHLFRTAFAEVLDALVAGRRAEVVTPTAAYAVTLDEFHRGLPMEPRMFEDILRRATRLCMPEMRVPNATGQDDHYELRVFRAVVEPIRYARLIAHATALRITPLALLGAACALAVRAMCDQSAQQQGDFFAVSVPRDMRVTLGREAQIGNLIYPQGIPILADDPRDLDSLSVLFFDRMQRGRANRLMYRHFAHRLRDSISTPVVVRGAHVGRLRTEDGDFVLQPLPIIGVTEVPRWNDIVALGEARVQQTFFQMPMISRRFADGMVHLGCTMRWHPCFDGRIRRLLDLFLQHLFGSEPVAWELL